MRGWDKITQRSIYQPYILVMQVLTLAGLSAVSERAPFHAELLIYALPGAAGAYLGLHAFHRLSDMQFHRLVSLALVASGFALVLSRSFETGYIPGNLGAFGPALGSATSPRTNSTTPF